MYNKEATSMKMPRKYLAGFPDRFDNKKIKAQFEVAKSGKSTATD